MERCHSANEGPCGINGALLIIITTIDDWYSEMTEIFSDLFDAPGKWRENHGAERVSRSHGTLTRPEDPTRLSFPVPNPIPVRRVGAANVSLPLSGLLVMYIPASFQVSDLAELHDFMARHSFATLISQVDGAPFASHLPLLIDRATQPYGRVIGHVAKANPQWQSLSGQRVLSIFHGPHAYVSPGWVEVANAVPTWNYVAVHAYGTARLIEKPARLRSLVQQMVDHYESGQPAPWTLDRPASEFIDGLLAAIVGFEITIDRLEGKWKLSQNHPRERREQVIRGLEAAARPDDLAIAELMAARVDRS